MYVILFICFVSDVYEKTLICEKDILLIYLIIWFQSQSIIHLSYSLKFSMAKRSISKSVSSRLLLFVFKITCSVIIPLHLPKVYLPKRKKCVITSYVTLPTSNIVLQLYLSNPSIKDASSLDPHSQPAEFFNGWCPYM